MLLSVNEVVFAGNVEKLAHCPPLTERSTLNPCSSVLLSTNVKDISFDFTSFTTSPDGAIGVTFVDRKFETIGAVLFNVNRLSAELLAVIKNFGI